MGEFLKETKTKRIYLLLSIGFLTFITLILVIILLRSHFRTIPYHYGIKTECNKITVYESTKPKFPFKPQSLTITLYKTHELKKQVLTTNTTQDLDKFIIEIPEKKLEYGYYQVVVKSKDNLNREHELINTIYYHQQCIDSDNLTYQDAIYWIKQENPELQNYEFNKFPNIITAYEKKSNWYIAFINERSGFPLSSATCFKVIKEKNKFTFKSNGKYTYKEEDGYFAILNPVTCQPLSEHDEIDPDKLIP